MCDGFSTTQAEHDIMLRRVTAVFRENTSWGVQIVSKNRNIGEGPMEDWIRFSMPGPLGQR